jgi:hypothetical protein
MGLECRFLIWSIAGIQTIDEHVNPLRAECAPPFSFLRVAVIVNALQPGALESALNQSVVATQ